MRGLSVLTRRSAWAAVIATIGSVAVATAVSAHGGDTALIHSCVKNGNIRIVGANDVCKDAEAPLDWNAQGVQGPAGPQGPTGATGPAGPAGPAPTIGAAIARATDTAITDSTPVDVVVITLQPGRWLLQGKAFVGTLNAHVGGSCTLNSDHETFIISQPVSGDALALLDLATFDATTTVALRCATDPGSTATIQVDDGVIVATQVGPAT